MANEFEHIDEFEYFLSPYITSGNNFKSVIDKNFEKEIVFALIEIVTLGDITNDVAEKNLNIGNTYVLSTLPEIDVKELIIKYKEIIKKVKEEKKFGIAEFKDWYHHGTYLFMDNKGLQNKITKTGKWYPYEIKEEPKNPRKYNYLSDVLEEEFVREYFQYYIKLMQDEDKFNFNMYEHICIMIRPLSVEDPTDGKIIPLGNLYLHFATKSEMKKEFYLKLINEIIYIWFRTKGSLIVRGLKNLLQEQQSKPWREGLNKRESRYENKIDDNGNEMLCFSIYLDKLFSTDYYRNIYKIQVESFLKFKSLFINYKLESNSDNATSEEKNFIENYIRLNSEQFYTSSIHIDEFIKFLVRRLIAFFCILLLDIPFKYVHEILSNGSFNKNITKLVEKEVDNSTVKYFITNLRIKIPEKLKVDKEERDSQYFTLYSNECLKIEKFFLKKCIENFEENHFYQNARPKIIEELNKISDNLDFLK
jgi:hypothetical protein